MEQGISLCSFLGFSNVCICLHSKQACVYKDGQKGKRTDPRGKTGCGGFIPARQKHHKYRGTIEYTQDYHQLCHKKISRAGNGRKHQKSREAMFDQGEGLLETGKACEK